MLFHLRKKGYNASIKINCDEKTLDVLIETFKSKKEFAHTPRRFYEWLLVSTRYDVELFENPIVVKF